MIQTICVDMPCRVRAFTSKNNDESYTIVINSRLNIEQQRMAYEHEFSHIKNGDFDSESRQIKNIGEIEREVRVRQGITL